MQIVGALLTAFVFLGPAFGSDALLVVPNAQTNSPGNVTDNIGAVGGVDFHFQEVVDNTEFPAGGKILITQVALRAAPGTGPITLTTMTILSLSTTPFAANAIGGNTMLTNTYATNIGPDNTVVFSGPVTFTSPGCAGPGVCPFDMVLKFASPFPYDPSQGSLLLDFEHIGGFTGGGFWDAVKYSPPGGPVAAVSNSGDITTGNVIPFGEVFQLSFTPTTPPSTTCPTTTASVGVLYSSQVAGTGGSGGYTWALSSGSLAPLTLSASGLVSGTPTAAGALNFTLNITDSAGENVPQPCTITVSPPGITFACPANTASVGVAYSFQLVSIGGSGSGIWSLTAGSLAPLTLSTGGLISGTPTAAGVLTFTVKIADSSGGSAQQPCTLTVTVPLSTTCPIASATIGSVYFSPLIGTGGSGAGYSWSLAGGSLAPLTLDPSGVVSGSANTAVVLNFTLKITDSAGSTAQQPCTIVFTSLGSSCPVFETAINVAYSSQLVGFGGSGGGYKWTLVSGSLGPLNLSAGGLVSGTPRAATTLIFNLLITDSAGGTSQEQCDIFVALPLGTTCPTATATVGVPFSQQLIGTGGFVSVGYTWSLAGGSLAPLTLSSGGLVSGTPTAAGTLSFTLQISDHGGVQAQQACTITVAAITFTQNNSTTGTNQTTLSVALPQAAATAFTGTLTLTFTPDPGLNNVPTGYVDPAGGFPVGSQSPTSFTFNFTIPQGATQPPTPPAFGRGTVAGTWTATLTALSTGGTSALVGSPPAQTVVIPLAAPVINGNTVKIINVTSTGFAVELTGSVTSRAVSSASFMFTPAAGGQLSGTSVTLPFNGQDQTQWFNTSAGQAAGGTFSLLVPFGYTGDPAAIGTVTVTLTGPQGTSVAVTGGE